MRLLSSDEVVKETGAPYRSLLEWIADGLFEPIRVMGSRRRTPIFDEQNVHEIRLFVQARHFIPRTHWRELACIVRKASAEEGGRVFVVARVMGNGSTELTLVGNDELDDLLKETEVRALVALEPKPEDGLKFSQT